MRQASDPQGVNKRWETLSINQSINQSINLLSTVHSETRKCKLRKKCTVTSCH